MRGTAAYRAETREIIAMLPGIHIRRLQKVLGASFNTTRYHVEALERNGEIVREKEGHFDRLYSAGLEEKDRKAFATLHGGPSRKVLQSLAEGASELTNGELADRTRLSRSTVSECISTLGAAALVRRHRAVDGRVLLGLVDPEGTTRMLAMFNRNILSLAADRFVDLWDV